MNKKTIIMLVCAIALFILGIAIFLYATNQNKLESKSNNETTANQGNEIDSQKNEFGFYDTEGNYYTVDDFSDKPIAMLLWKSNTEGILGCIRLFEKYYDSYSDKINFLVINTSEHDNNIVEHIEASNFSINIYFDKENTAANGYEFESLPCFIFINADGSILNKREGNMSEDSFEANLDLLSHNY